MEILEFLKSLMDPDTWLNLKEELSFLGPLYGALLTMVESFIPPLPLILFVTANVFTFGFVVGSLSSWIGTCLGSGIVYFLFYKYGKAYFEKANEKHEFLRKLSRWVDRKGIRVIFILLCFPFTPSFLVNIFAAAIRLKPSKFLPVLISGRFIMIGIFGIIGQNIYSSLDNPIRLIIIGIIIVIGYIMAKVIYNKLNF